ncbi:MAG: peptide-methionine (S)-S-oxide reductase MsrA [Proteobacteria bacterium]|nr:peptide-methionine (S)-S-oxide reductase MsrA [Pseudomonadota bacterium]
MNAIIAAILSLLCATAACAMEKTVMSDSVKPNQKINPKTDYIVLGMGCFWGAEKRMSEIPGVLDVESGYAGGDLPGVGYQQILNHERMLRAGRITARNHAEVIKVTFDAEKATLETVLAKFWENHNPTQGDRQGNDIGSNYRSAIYYHDDAQKDLALHSQNVYQQALNTAGYGKITTEILPLKNYITAEEYHQDYLWKNPNGYCGLGGTGVKYPATDQKAAQNASMAGSAGAERMKPLDGKDLNFSQQLVIFEAEHCEFCKQFDNDVLNNWQAEVPVVATMNTNPPAGWTLEKPLFAAPTIVLFRNGKEVTRYTGYNGEKANFWKWLGFQLLSPEQQKIAFAQGTEPPFTATNLDEKRPGKFVDPVSGAPLFLSQAKFNSGTGWPSFFDPVEGSVTLHDDNSHGMHRVEVRSASSGIHLGHVFDDGPPPSYKRYCINGNVLKFVPD